MNQFLRRAFDPWPRVWVHPQATTDRGVARAFRMTFFLLSAASILLALAQATTPPGPAAPAPSSPAAPAPSPSKAITPNDPKERMELAKKVNGLLEMDIPWHL